MRANCCIISAETSFIKWTADVTPPPFVNDKHLTIAPSNVPIKIGRSLWKRKDHFCSQCKKKIFLLNRRKRERERKSGRLCNLYLCGPVCGENSAVFVYIICCCKRREFPDFLKKKCSFHLFVFKLFVESTIEIESSFLWKKKLPDTKNMDIR